MFARRQPGTFWRWSAAGPASGIFLGGENLPYRTFCARVAAIAGVRPPRWALPYAAMLPFAAAGSILGRLMPVRFRDFNLSILRSGFLEHYATSRKACTELGYNEIAIDEAIRDALDWFAGHGYMQREFSGWLKRRWVPKAMYGNNGSFCCGLRRSFGRISFCWGSSTLLLVRKHHQGRVTPARRSWPFVSYVVPARNEEDGHPQGSDIVLHAGLPGTLRGHRRQRPVHRPDAGASSPSCRRSSANLTVVEGQEPPPDWFGKPNALQIGRAPRQGRVDPDGRRRRRTRDRTCCDGGWRMHLREKAAMLTIRPRHVSGGVFEAVLMSGVNFFFFVATPIFLVRYSRSPIFATGSPVFNLIRRDVLDSLGGFACMKQALVDDLEIGQRVNKRGTGWRWPSPARRSSTGCTAGRARSCRDSARTRSRRFARCRGCCPSTSPRRSSSASFRIGVSCKVSMPGGSTCQRRSHLPSMHAVFAGIAWRYRNRGTSRF